MSAKYRPDQTASTDPNITNWRDAPGSNSLEKMRYIWSPIVASKLQSHPNLYSQPMGRLLLWAQDNLLHSPMAPMAIDRWFDNEGLRIVSFHIALFEYICNNVEMNIHDKSLMRAFILKAKKFSVAEVEKLTDEDVLAMMEESLREVTLARIADINEGVSERIDKSRRLIDRADRALRK